MSAAGKIAIRAAGDLSSVAITRGDGVPDVFWSKVIAEWGVSGSRANDKITTSLERFLSNLSWVKPACIAHRVELDIDASSRHLILRSGQDRQALQQIKAGSLAPVDLNQRLTGTRFIRDLRQFQRRDLEKLLRLPNGANFSVPGAGKTTVTYALYEAEKHAGRVQRLLVVAPLSAFEAWHEEIGKSFNQPLKIHAFDGGPIPDGAEVCIVNYQRLTSNYQRLSQWVSERPTHVVLDEAHRAKRGWTGEWGRACLSLAYLAARRDILTGTPAPQGLRDLDALLDFTWPGLSRSILPLQLFARNPPAGVTGLVQTAIAPFFTRTTKHDLDLPDIDFKVRWLPLEGLQANIYKALRNEYAGHFALNRRDRYDFMRMGQVVMYLLEAATNPQLLVAGSSELDAPEFKHPPLDIGDHTELKTLLAEYPLYETPRKFVELARIVKANADLGRKTLVWSNFVRNLSTLERIFARYEPAVVHGGVPSKISQPNAPRTRDAELDRFRNDAACLVLLANPAAMSEGVSLHRHCHDAVYLDRTFNAGQYLQSLDRIHRLGLEPGEDTRVTFLLTEGTIDAVVDDRIAAKATRLGDILNDSAVEEMALPDDEDYGGPIESADDLTALFKHLRGE